MHIRIRRCIFVRCANCNLGGVDKQDQAMTAALAARAVKAKLAKDSGEAAVLKRPAAGKVGRPPKGDGAVLKKPAAARAALPAGFKLNVTSLLTKKLAKSCSRGAFTTRGSSLGKKLARDAGLTNNEVIAAGSIGYAKCAEFWDDQN